MARHTLPLDDQWAVMNHVIFDLQARFPHTEPWRDDHFNDGEKARVQQQLLTLIRQRLEHVNQSALSNPPTEASPLSDRELIRRNLPCRSYYSDNRELDEITPGYLRNYRKGELYAARVTGSGNVWVLGVGTCKLYLSPAAQWASYLNRLYAARSVWVPPAPDPNRARELDLHGNRTEDWASF